MRVPPNVFKMSESQLNKDLDLSDSFMLSSTNSITMTRKHQAKMTEPEMEAFKQSGVV